MSRPQQKREPTNFPMTAQLQRTVDKKSNPCSKKEPYRSASRPVCVTQICEAKEGGKLLQAHDKPGKGESKHLYNTSKCTGTVSALMIYNPI